MNYISHFDHNPVAIWLISASIFGLSACTPSSIGIVGKDHKEWHDSFTHGEPIERFPTTQSLSAAVGDPDARFLVADLLQGDIHFVDTRALTLGLTQERTGGAKVIAERFDLQDEIWIYDEKERFFQPIRGRWRSYCVQVRDDRVLDVWGPPLIPFVDTTQIQFRSATSGNDRRQRSHWVGGEDGPGG